MTSENFPAYLAQNKNRCLVVKIIFVLFSNPKPLVESLGTVYPVWSGR